jgi:large subunit ribosomal protein L31
MKEGIHPKYYEDAETKCACGHIFQAGSVKKNMSIEICSQCHPFYTGKQRMLDKEGRIEKFKKKYAKFNK